MASSVSLTLVPAERASEDTPDETSAPLRIEAASPSALRDPPGRSLHRERLTDGGGLTGCLACGHPELYTQKDFPRAVGIALVVVAAVLAPFTYYLSLVAVALLDAVLYVVAKETVVCYVCRAEHRGFPDDPRHPRFDREIEERLLFGAKAVMGRPMREGGTANAPEPEH